jgi:hypothetical protein
MSTTSVSTGRWDSEGRGRGGAPPCRGRWILPILLAVGLGGLASPAQAAWITGSMFNIDVQNFTGGVVNDFEMFVSNITCSDVGSYFTPAGWNPPDCEIVGGGVKITWRGPNTPPNAVPHFGVFLRYCARTERNPRITKIQWTRDGEPRGGLSFEGGWTGGGASCRVGTIFRNTDRTQVAVVQRAFAPIPAVLPLDVLVPGNPVLEDQPFRLLDERPVAVAPGQSLAFDFQSTDEAATLLRTRFLRPLQGGRPQFVAELVEQAILSRQPCPTGGLAGTFVNRAGQPLVGLQVTIDGTDRQAVTGPNGAVRFDEVASGPATLSVAQTFVIVEPTGNLSRGQADLSPLATVEVRPQQVTEFRAVVEAPQRVQAVAACPCVPWCIVGGLVNPITGTWTARGAAGRTGACPCGVVVAGLPGPLACPGSGPSIGGPLPNPGLPRSVTTNVACAPPPPPAACGIVF